jgi:glutathione-specific gamma-glutamylcyclotransferase
MPRRLALTREMIAAAFPAPIPDDGWTIPVRDDAELERLLSIELEGCPQQGGLWLFAYGSLMWKPDIVFDAVKPAIVDGWQRRFCLWQRRYRGCRERPNLMLALVQGGSCAGLVYRLAGKDVKSRLAPIWKREMIAFGYEARWVSARTAEGIVPALAFVAWTEGPRYAGVLDEEEIAARIASACGHVGPGADYLRETADKCAELGIEDEHIFRIETMVARRLTGVSQ